MVKTKTSKNCIFEQKIVKKAEKWKGVIFVYSKWGGAGVILLNHRWKSKLGGRMQILEDQKLVRQSKRGDRAAFEALYEKYLDPMLTIAMNLLGEAAAAEDVVQEVFVRFVQSLKDFTLRGTLKGFLATCVANRARDLLRQRARRQDMPLDMAAPASAGSEEPVALAIRNEQLQILQNGLSLLPYEQREVITLRHQGGLTFKEIAACQGVPVQTVQSRYTYGLDKLRVLLNGEVPQ